ASWRTTKAIAEQRVDNEIGSSVDELFRIHFRPGRRGEHLSLMRRHGTQMLCIGQTEPYLGSVVRQVAGSTDPPASLPARACQHNDERVLPRGCYELNRERREIAPCILHHLKQIRSGLFRRDSVNLAHLSGADSRDLDACI